jgi:hypothetical protein
MYSLSSRLKTRASFKKSFLSLSSSFINFLMTKFPCLYLARKTALNNPRPIDPPNSVSFFQSNTGNLSPKITLRLYAEFLKMANARENLGPSTRARRFRITIKMASVDILLFAKTIFLVLPWTEETPLS